eukprot:TRINITY_DN46452_c0_g1_i1.p1 TRINITY_DN46452_c0_g1~~TRINITY_DN46452_c0_g1_i1.p1  ORF type:complete len:393 (-),score=35.75 TRINITY_DN46452_c0_g1_i1:80-1258(-)
MLCANRFPVLLLLWVALAFAQQSTNKEFNVKVPMHFHRWKGEPDGRYAVSATLTDRGAEFFWNAMVDTGATVAFFSAKQLKAYAEGNPLSSAFRNGWSCGCSFYSLTPLRIMELQLTDTDGRSYPPKPVRAVVGIHAQYDLFGTHLLDLLNLSYNTNGWLYKHDTSSPTPIANDTEHWLTKIENCVKTRPRVSALEALACTKLKADDVKDLPDGLETLWNKSFAGEHYVAPQGPNPAVPMPVGPPPKDPTLEEAELLAKVVKGGGEKFQRLIWETVEDQWGHLWTEDTIPIREIPKQTTEYEEDPETKATVTPVPQFHMVVRVGSNYSFHASFAFLNVIGCGLNETLHSLNGVNIDVKYSTAFHLTTSQKQELLTQPCESPVLLTGNMTAAP